MAKGAFENWKEKNRRLDSWYEDQVTGDNDLSFTQRMKLLWEYVKLVVRSKDFK